MTTIFQTKTGALKAALRDLSDSIERALSIHEAHLLEMAEAEIAAIDGGLRLLAEMRATHGRSGVLTPKLAAAIDDAQDDYLRLRLEQMNVRDALWALASTDEGGVA